MYMETLLLAFGKFRWFVRYPAAALMFWASWHMFTVNHYYMIPTIFAFCGVVITKEASPSLLLLVASVWLWPESFLNTPFAQMTFGIILSALASLLVFVAAPFVAMVLYNKREYARYVSELA